ncbi:uncharacterized protein EI90DRAFT_825459 [Cantharellus anzutake]|uniref:uncharacterized protein n=1 Tax=Cantharellus anzutake TaxID=1750568 RepID=UPI00190891EE|nr:uncharacterized protein EI90DRAFT_825459 [Cantharellus anzutake]KAF8343066.1 hypothetical protein EI90DRAFT_825459 [Cantharellus anzutake]
MSSLVTASRSRGSYQRDVCTACRRGKTKCSPRDPRTGKCDNCARLEKKVQVLIRLMAEDSNVLLIHIFSTCTQTTCNVLFRAEDSCNRSCTKSWPEREFPPNCSFLGPSSSRVRQGCAARLGAREEH